MANDREVQRNQGLIAFRASPELMDRIDASAAQEGISRADVARRAVLRDLGSQVRGEAA